MLSRQSCILDSLPCIPDSKWILDSNLKFQISQAKFPGFWMPQYSSRIPESGVPCMGRQGRAISLLHLLGLDDCLPQTVACYRHLLICKVRKYYFSKLCQEFYLPSVGTQSELSDLSCHDDHTVVVVFFFQVHRRWNQHGRGPPFYWEGPFYSNNKTAHIYDRHRFLRDLHSCCLAEWSQPLFPGLII